MNSDSRCTSCQAGKSRVIGAAGTMDQCGTFPSHAHTLNTLSRFCLCLPTCCFLYDLTLSAGYTVLRTFGGWTFYKVPVPGVLSDTNVVAACAAAGLRTPCAGGSGCSFNNLAYCVITSEIGCGNPMYSLSQAICGTSVYPSNCPATYNLFTYMGGSWSGGSACGALSGQWCVEGRSYSNMFAVCV